jgi:multidrug efflux pump subunit AcrB
MARNPVAANLLLVVLILGGFVSATQVRQEVFPEFSMDMITVAVPYPGASPSEVEKGILLALEEAVRGVDGVKRVIASANESVGTLFLELELGVNPNRALGDVKSAVDLVRSLPEEAEDPSVSLIMNRREVISLVIYGNYDEFTLRNLAEEARDGLLRDDRITVVEVSGVKPPEISVEVPQDTLRARGLTLEEVAMAIRMSSVELPAGGVKTQAGEILLRTDERKEVGSEIEDIIVRTDPSGAKVRVRDVARVTDAFEDLDEESRYDGLPAVMVQVFRSGEQTPLDVAEATKAFRDRFQANLPEGVKVAIWNDMSEIYADRIGLLLRNARLGLVLVFLILGMFLEVRLAFWVTMGIPASFFGSLLIVPSFGVSINMISLFAFIVTLGMVVDDAIVVGENVFEHRSKGKTFLQAAIDGGRGMAVPVTFSILTTVAAFTPMFFVPGISGKFFMNIPAVVVAVLLVSLIESFFVLPAHLAHTKSPDDETGVMLQIVRFQQKIAGLLTTFVKQVYAPVLDFALRWRYLTLTWAVGTFMIAVGLLASGRAEFSFMPAIDSDVITAAVELPVGAPVETTKAIQQHMVKAAQEVFDDYGSQEELSRGIFAQVGKPMMGFGPVAIGGKLGGSHFANVRIFLVGVDKRNFTGGEFAKKWREKVGEIPGVKTMSFKSSMGPSSDAPVNVQLMHRDTEILRQASAEVAQQLKTFPGLISIDDGFSAGKTQLDITLKPAARELGFTAASLGRQLRAAFFGAEANRQQRGRDELKVMVRLPKEERRSEYIVENLMVGSPMGGMVPLRQVAELKRGKSYTKISREDGRRVVDVTADIESDGANPGKVLSALDEEFMPELVKRFPGLHYSFEGESRAQRESLGALRLGFMLALLVIYSLLAVPFKSYIQPVVVMSAIPFGFVGALWGHMIMGYNLSLISIMGIIALSGIVVNDSLVLIAATNDYRRHGSDAFDAIKRGGMRRFRPILLTSLTTFFGLAPMIFETSIQARFLIPMAISLGFGVLFATFIILLLVPALYLIVEDVAGIFGIQTTSLEKHDGPGAM